MSDAKEEAAKLLVAVLPFAKDMIREHGEFYPFGAVLRSDGSVLQVSAKEERNDRPRSSTLLAILKDNFQQMANRGEIVASAIVLNREVMPPHKNSMIDAIHVILDHREQYSAEVFVPYHRETDGKTQFETMFAWRGNHEVFGTDKHENPNQRDG